MQCTSRSMNWSRAELVDPLPRQSAAETGFRERGSNGLTGPYPSSRSAGRGGVLDYLDRMNLSRLRA